MSDVLIVGAAPVPGAEAFYAGLLAASSVVVAADAAAEWCVSLGRIPDAAVGDFDSAEAGAAGRLETIGVSVARFPAAKDESDLDLCVTVARQSGGRRIAFTAAFSARLDHTLAALGTVLDAGDLEATVLEPELTGIVVDGVHRSSVTLSIPSGMTFSVLSPAGATEVTVSGGRYTLTRGDLGSLSSRGLSNVAADGPIRVSVREGRALVLVDGAVGVPPWTGSP